ncbi:hypothetical protein Patl1_17705 [Pistacia atlantica]|uniref:Uncharacterized protein n=1 Tax=Pistacia atlantica TaxID=434234 RepID=A0ACC1BZ03_9ROSI|nr:hypothetical protein Patl1_17705 [Pistacia atlantica]
MSCCKTSTFVTQKMVK